VPCFGGATRWTETTATNRAVQAWFTVVNTYPLQIQQSHCFLATCGSSTLERERRKWKILKKRISAKDGQGSVLLGPETDEDLWHAYNLLQAGDLVRCTTLRKVVNESSTGSTTSSKKRLMLTMRVDRIDFDSDIMQVRKAGVTVGEQEHVRVGAHHTLTLEKQQNFSLEK
jgi:eRF1 domain 1